MDTTTLLLWIHIVAFVAGGSNTVVMPIIGTTLPMVDEATRATLFRIGFQMATIGKVAAATLLITGPLLLWLRYGGVEGLNGWFKLKMALVAVIVLTIGLSMRGMARLKRGDEGGGKLMKVAGPLTTLTAAAIALAAVFSFH